MPAMTVKGRAKIVKIYDVKSMEIDESVDLDSQEEVRNLFELVNEFVETGEADALQTPIEIRGVDPDESTITISNRKYLSDELTLKNVNILELLEPIQQAQEGDLFYIRSSEGDGLWDFESDKELDATKVKIGYLDCALFFDQYDVLREGYLEVICDTLLPEEVEYPDAIIQLSDFVFQPVQVFAQLYVVKKDPIEGIKLLQKVDFGGRMIAGTDFIVDDFDLN
ncbi:MAG: hypothetical protein GXO61_01665 [Epsilonproteobacteria bacterium]|nr:hypothetical protein [Campylobacterota bacterium]